MSGAPPRILLATSEDLSRYLLLYDSRTEAAAPSRFGSGSLPLLAHERHAFPATEPAYETLLAAAAKHSSAPRELRPPGGDLPRISDPEKISELHRSDLAASCARAAACCAFRWRRKPARRAFPRLRRRADFRSQLRLQPHGGTDPRRGRLPGLPRRQPRQGNRPAPLGPRSDLGIYLSPERTLGAGSRAPATDRRAEEKPRRASVDRQPSSRRAVDGSGFLWPEFFSRPRLLRIDRLSRRARVAVFRAVRRARRFQNKDPSVSG